MPRNNKKFTEYISPSSTPFITLDEYVKSPACAFLKYVVGANNASNQCLRNFHKNGNGKFSKAALQSIQIINTGLLASIMGNFETFQKYLFAQMFEYSIYLKQFEVKEFMKNTKVQLDITRCAAFRDNPTGIGLMLADALKEWHNPEAVNNFFSWFNLLAADNHPRTLFSNEDEEDLHVLWQMRHSIVHTAGVITKPDAQKVTDLKDYGNAEIILQPLFILQVARKMHKLTKEMVGRMEEIYMPNIKPGIPLATKNVISKLFLVESTESKWLK